MEVVSLLRIKWLFVVLIGGFTCQVHAAQIDVFFTGTVDDPGSTELETGDGVQGAFRYESTTPAYPTTSFHPWAINNFDFLVIDASTGDVIEPTFSIESNTIYVDADSIAFSYGAATHAGGYFRLDFLGSSTPFENNLETATAALIGAGSNAINLFGGGQTNFILGTEPFGFPVYFIVDSIAFTQVPEPATLGLLGIGLSIFCYKRQRLPR